MRSPARRQTARQLLVVQFIERLGTGVDVLPPVKGVARVGALTVTVLDVDGVDEAVSQSFASGDATR
jgi:hypothetical protein